MSFEKIEDFFSPKEPEEHPRRSFPAEIFREYDIRGVIDSTLFEEDGYDVGRAFGTVLAKKNLKKICVGHDCRVSSDNISRNLLNGLLDSGTEVISLGLCHTPLVYYTVNKFKLDGGIMITGSHNPPEYNGFKFMLGLDPFYGENLKKLAKLIAGKNYIDGVGREIVMNNIFLTYVNEIISDFSFSDDLKVAWDIGNGATSNAIKAITTLIPGKHHVLFEEMDGTFPNRPPDPIVARNVKYLSKFVRYNGFDVGFAFDSDGDRLCVVNNKGEVLYSDQVLMVLAKDFLKKNPGAQVIADVKSCDRLFDTIRKCGGIGLMERVGHSFIKSRMKSSGALLAGELSGHFFFKDRWYGFDDAIYAALRCLEILSIDKDAFSDLPYGYVTPEIRITCEEEEKFKIIDSLKKDLKERKMSVVDIDGVRVSTDIGWWVLRASNTQNALSLRIEAYSERAMYKLKHEISDYLCEYIPNILDCLNESMENDNKEETAVQSNLFPF